MTEHLDINQFQKIYQNTIDMFKARKYIMKEYYKCGKQIKITDDDLIENYKNENCKLIINKGNDEILSVYFYNSKIGINELKELFGRLQEENVKHLILITKYKLTSYAKKEMKILGKNMEKELFYFSEMIFNITKHELVPKHELLTEKETKIFVQNIGKKIPQIKITDKVCRYFNGKIDQIFRIYRKNEIYYRIVTA